LALLGAMIVMKNNRAWTIWPGKPFPLGATFDGSGVNFALFSEHASGVELCLFDDDSGKTELAKIPLTERTNHVWHGYIPRLRPGQRYGYRVYGAYSPEQGHRFNPAKLLLDPYAKAIAGQIEWHDAVFGYTIGAPGGDLTQDERDSAAYMPKAVVVDDWFDWGSDRPPKIPFHDTIIYELHVKGQTFRHPSVPAHLRGTYAGLCHPASIRYLKALGITAVELMPVHSFVSDRLLEERGLHNYWGYNSIGFFAPDSRYASAKEPEKQVAEFKRMIKTLHRAGIEVILDVVYNHTAEGNHCGPTLSFRGIDNAAYYRLVHDQRRYYMDYTGTGNTLNMMSPAVLRLIMDSLRYWIQEMHVDGFRFDLASALARELHAVDRLGAFFDIIHQDPVISQVKLIAEPWDIGDGGYQVGNFPPGWAEWNGKYRDSVRDYWRGAEQTLSDFAYRFTGSSDLYQNDGRHPTASINFITAHDGFTLRDLVSYHEKRNDANGEGNRDGESHNRSWNCGAEGDTDDPNVLALRAKQQRNFFTTLLLSQGVPMLLAGDEFGRTQRGNNNAYCQDSELSWVDWGAMDQALLNWTRFLIRFRKQHPTFRRNGWFQGQPIHGGDVSDIGWFTRYGSEMQEPDWRRGVVGSLGVFLNGRGIRHPDEKGRPVTDQSFYLIFNSHYESMIFILPDERWGRRWQVVFDTHQTQPRPSRKRLNAGHALIVEARSVMLLQEVESKNWMKTVLSLLRKQ